MKICDVNFNYSILVQTLMMVRKIKRFLMKISRHKQASNVKLLLQKRQKCLVVPKKIHEINKWKKLKTKFCLNNYVSHIGIKQRNIQFL